MDKTRSIGYRINELLRDIPDDKIDKTWYSKKVKEYSTACGCSLGAVFLIVSATVFLFYFYASYKNTGVIKCSLQGFLFIFLSAITGKILGLVIAKIRLTRLYFLLIKKHRTLCQLVQNGQTI